MSKEPFLVGKVVGFQGLRGEVKIRPSTNNPELLLDITNVRLEMPGEKLDATVSDMRLDRRMLFVKFKGYNDRTAVEFMQDAEVFVDKDQVADLDEDEWWVTDLVGLPAYTTSGAAIGTISGIIDAGNQILEISAGGDGKTILVPFVKDLVPVVDIKGRRVEISDLPGLLEPQ
jgi:16S rRNA processing protein RimM